MVKKAELTGASEEAEGRCSSLVRSGRCSGRGRSRNDGRRWRRSPEAEQREEDDAKRHGGNGENDPSVLFIRRRDKWQVRESRSQKMDKLIKVSPR